MYIYVYMLVGAGLEMKSKGHELKHKKNFVEQPVKIITSFRCAICESQQHKRRCLP